ncbi:MAG: hypothetical protein AB7U82_17380 [Blastocatellales bacterium]
MKGIVYFFGHLRTSLFTFAIIALSLSLTSSQAWTKASAYQTREIRVVPTDAVAGQNISVTVELVSLGNENAIGFSLNYNPAIFSNPIVTLGNGATGATPNFNTNQAASGRLGIGIAFGAGQTFAAGTRQIVNVSFAVAANAPAGPTQITFGNQPTVQEVADVNAGTLPATFTPGTINVVLPNPAPKLVGLSPFSATAGGAGFNLAVTGMDFVNGAEVRWNGSPRATTFNTATNLIAVISAQDIANAGTATITVRNPAPGGGPSTGLTFTVNNPTPVITTLSPNAATAGSGDVAITVNGTGFVSTSKVRFNGADLATNFISATQLTATIPSGSLTTVGVANITVFNPVPGGGTSSAVSFAINNPVPTIAGLSPASVTAGGSDFTLTVNGTNFISGSVIRINGNDHATNFISATQLTAPITAAEIAAAATASITVFNPAPGGGLSNAINFTINNPAPAITTLSPSSKVAGDQNFTLTVNGTGFVTGSTVQWNGANRTTNLVGATQLTAAISAADIASVGTANVTVVNSAPGGGTSNAASFSITQPPLAPTIASLSPGFAIAGGQQFTLTVNGTNFAGNSVVRWNDSDRVTTFVSATQLRATIPATDIASQGTVSIKVFTPAPGGGTSNALQFFVGAQVTSVSAASFVGNELADASIIAAFGVNLATQVQSATTQPLPTDLAGTKVTIRDSAGTERLAPLFFVAPQQTNYQLPPGTVDGLATVVVTSGDNKISVGSLQVSRVAPGVFSANANGLGVAAAAILRVKADGSQVFEPMVRFDSGQNSFVSIPVDLGPDAGNATDQVFLVMFGTGFRFRSAMSGVSAAIGGSNAQVLYADVAPGFIGLDQTNIRIARSLIGRGEVDVVLTVDGKVANMVKLNIK